MKSSLISCMFKAAIALLVICYWKLLAFQSGQKCGTENRSLLLHVLTVTVEAITQVPSSTSVTTQNKFSQFFQSSYGYFHFLSVLICVQEMLQIALFSEEYPFAHICPEYKDVLGLKHQA